MVAMLSVSALELGGIKPTPDTTKRETAQKLTTMGSWPLVCYAITYALEERSITSQKELNLCIAQQGFVPAATQRLRGSERNPFLFPGVIYSE